ncbi:MAG TPA: hypothetical protein VGC59_11835 [Solirubrobacteraceae bacterium]
MPRLVVLSAAIAGLLCSPAAAAGPRVVLSGGGDPAPWRALLEGLVHGPEISSATLLVTSPARTAALCGGGRSCYDAGAQTIVTSGTPPPGYTVAEIVAHEYGHHVAAHQRNAPWDAYDWGTKRWASYEGVCSGVAAGQLFPGDQGSHYAENPGEAFADAYRVLNGGRGPSPFDPRLAPNGTSLALLRQDIEHPWRGPTTLRRSIAAPARVTVDTPLDGTFVATAPGRRVRILDAATGRVLGSGRSRARARVCGEDAVTVAVSGHARLRLRMARP